MTATSERKPNAVTRNKSYVRVLPAPGPIEPALELDNPGAPASNGKRAYGVRVRANETWAHSLSNTTESVYSYHEVAEGRVYVYESNEAAISGLHAALEAYLESPLESRRSELIASSVERKLTREELVELQDLNHALDSVLNRIDAEAIRRFKQAHVRKWWKPWLLFSEHKG